MSTITVTPAELPRELQRLAGLHKKALARGMRRGAQRGRTFIARKTPVDTGELKASWKVRGPRGDGRVFAELVNDAPHAGVIEHGARPHRVSVEGFLNLVEWARRHGMRTRFRSASRLARSWRSPYGIVFYGNDIAPAKAAYGIVRKLNTQGQKPTYFVRSNLDELRALVIDEVRDQLRRADRRAT